MKKFLLSIFLISIYSGLSAQDFYVSFQPKDTGSQIDSIQVTNQKTNQKIKLLGNESLFLKKGTTGINPLKDIPDKGYILQNQNNGDANLYFSTNKNQTVELLVYNISGQLLSKNNQTLTSGSHSFSIQFPKNGIYSILVHKNDGPISVKAVSLADKNQNCTIMYQGSEKLSNSNSSDQLKSLAVGKELSFSLGDILQYSVFSGQLITTMNDSPKNTMVYSVEFYACSDGNQKNYGVIKLGSQVWMAENLAYLPAVSPGSAGSKTDKHYYVWYYNGNDVVTAKATTNYKTYGVLYNWPAAKASCPPGWHLPSNVEVQALKDYLINNGYGFGGSGIGIAKSMAANTSWTDYPEVGVPGNDLPSNNRSGFSALPGGDRFTNGSFYNLGGSCAWWMATEMNANAASYYGLNNNSANFLGYYADKDNGYSVRCIKD